MSALADNVFMTDDTWKTRLAEAIDSSNKSKRQVSLDSGNGPGYVHSILTEGKDPTITKLLAVCKAVPVSPMFILHGLEVTPAQEEVITAMNENPKAVEGIISLLKFR